MSTQIKNCLLGLAILFSLTATASAQGLGGLTNGSIDPFNKNNKLGGSFSRPKPNPGSTSWEAAPVGPQAGRDFTRIVIKNNSSRSMRVAVDFTPFSANGQTGRVTKTWYQMDPGGQIYVGDTNVQWFAFYAESLDQSVTWGGDTMITVPRDTGSQSVGFRVVDTGSQRQATWAVPLGD
jgi:hypothetical protein